MTEYIDREMVLNILASKNAPWDGYQKVSELPSADVQPVVYAKWIETMEDAEYDYGYRHIRKLKCSCCGYYQSKSNIADSGALLKSRYCPDCGAKMDGKN